MQGKRHLRAAIYQPACKYFEAEPPRRMYQVMIRRDTWRRLALPGETAPRRCAGHAKLGCSEGWEGDGPAGEGPRLKGSYSGSSFHLLTL